MSRTNDTLGPVRAEYRLRPMTLQDAELISRWRYPPPYDVYNGPDPASAAGERCGWFDPLVRSRQYRSVDWRGGLCGFVQWFPLIDEAGGPIVRLGLGLRPELCGGGRGAGFARFAAHTASSAHPNARIELEVAADNLRALKAYEKAGFIADDEYEAFLPGRGLVPVVCMAWRGTET